MKNRRTLVNFSEPGQLERVTLGQHLNEKSIEALKPDLVSVATGGYEYSSDHYLPTIQALEAGCHVLTEKPISNLIGGLACYGTMLATVWRDLKKLETTEEKA